MKHRDQFHYILFILLLSFIIFTPSIVNNKIERIFEVSSPSIKSSGTIQCYSPQIYVDFENNIHTTWTSSGESDDFLIQQYSLVYAKKSMNSTSWSDIKTLYTPTDDIYQDAEFIVDKKENPERRHQV